MTTQSFQMANQLDAVDPMVLSLKQQVENHLSDEAQFRFDVCISEVLVNLVLHAQTSEKNTSIDINLAMSPDETAIEIFDPAGAAAFDIRENGRALSEVDTMAENGRGLGLILECADRVDYGTVARRNRLRLAFWRRD